jgi:hypothetical protein
MKTENIIYLALSCVFTVIGSSFIGLALWMLFWTRYFSAKVLANAPNVADKIFDDRLIYWPLFIGGVFMALACGGFLSLILSRRRHQHEHAA